MLDFTPQPMTDLNRGMCAPFDPPQWFGLEGLEGAGVQLNHLPLKCEGASDEYH